MDPLIKNTSLARPFQDAFRIPAGSVLPRTFFSRPALQVARALLGQVLVHGPHRGRIVEVEAYLGPRDLAAHSSKGRTARTEVMFGPAGHAYVYFIYGMHHCMNVTTGNGCAVLLRAVEPLTPMDARTDGPGRLCKAFAISREQNALSLSPPGLWLERGVAPRSGAVARGPRIGVDYAGAWAKKPYRLWIADNPFVSR